MSLKTVKRIASDIMKVGASKLKLRQGEEKRVKEALTRDDVRAMIQDGVITAEKKRGVSRARARKKQEQKKKGRRKGPGSKKGTKYSKVSQKTQWMGRIRAQRALLKGLISDGEIDNQSYKKLYRMAKGQNFKSVAALKTYAKENKMLKG